MAIKALETIKPKTTGRKLQIFRDGRRTVAKQLIQLPPGAQGNLQTLFEMAKIVRFDATQNDLKAFVMREIVGLDKTSRSEQIETAFRFANDSIIYTPEKDGFETIADLWSCMYALNPLHPSGDCVVKSVALATCLAFLGLKSSFVAVRQIPNVDFYNHVYLSVEVGNGQSVAMDATPPKYRIGQEVESLQRVIYPIFK